MMPIHGRNLHLPLSHALPVALNIHPFYDRLPGRIGVFVRQRYGHVKCIDVGANIGDTIAAFYQKGADNDSLLAIEPNKKFLKYLRCNWKDVSTVTILSVVCSSESMNRNYRVLEKHGTASVVYDQNGTAMETRSLDDIVEGNPHFTDLNILKIDTDGHDFEVIAGARIIIERIMPVVLFECDAFSNSNYVRDCMETFKFFETVGYNRFLFYDNFGNLMGKCLLSDLSQFRGLLFYQLTSKFFYFDVLLMRDEDIDLFFREETSYFIEHMDNKTLYAAAASAIGDQCVFTTIMGSSPKDVQDEIHSQKTT
jgi:FkbM family methyltransferase